MVKAPIEKQILRFNSALWQKRFKFTIKLENS
jgi:hypothetical protein